MFVNKESTFDIVVAKIVMINLYFIIINKKKIINIDNSIKESYYQKNFNFSHLNSTYKILAVYYPQNYSHIINFVEGKKSLTNEKKNIDFSKALIEQQVKLAKDHGIYGFGIVYNCIEDKIFNEGIINIFSNCSINNFPFFIIFNDIEGCFQNVTTSLIYNSTLIETCITNFIDGIKKYFISNNYIKLKGKYILGFFNLSNSSRFLKYIKNNKTIRKKLYIISIFHIKKNLDYLNSSNSFIKLPSPEIWLKNNLSQKYFYHFYFHNLFNEANTSLKYITNFFIMNGCKPEKFYIIFKKYLKIRNPEKNHFLIFNAWNNYKENLYLEPDKEFGYSYLNYLSKAIFNLDDNVFYELEILKNKCKIAVQVHLFYEDLMNDIIKKTNNIPVKFDLYISIVFPEKYNEIINYINCFTKANYFEILIVENKGRDVLPFLNQIKMKYKYYKYLCHLHTKKTKKVPEIGFLWRNYLFNNLIGSTNIISKILYDFENDNKLGFIFPETFYGIIKYFYILTKENKKWMNFLASKFFSNCIIGEKLDYPAGNMFWAKISAIFQIFVYDLSSYFSNEKNQTDDTIMHGIERIWLYLVKYNRFNYKTITYYAI